MDTLFSVHRKWRVTWLVAVVALVTSVLAGEIQEYCKFDTLEATCPDGQVVLLEHALYGRMGPGRCISESYGSMGCQTSVLPYVDSVCSGRRRCELNVPQIGLQGIRPCSDELVSFMEAAYTCLPVVKPRESQCRYDNYYALPPPNGYLSSEAVPVSETGSPSPCSWRLTASPGQQINLTLYDFSVWQYGQGSGSSRGRTVCRRYAIISEGDGIRESPICGGTTRVKNIFISEGNMVDIRLMNSNDPDERAYFIIKYETFGCSQLKPPRNAHLIRLNGHWVVKCNHTAQSWRVYCDGKKWVGTVGNCTAAKDDGLWNVLTDDWSSPYGVLIVVGLGVVLGVIVGILLLGLALLWLRSRRRKRHDPNNPLGKNITEVECEDPFIHNYQTPYNTNGEPDYASWINQRPLPRPSRDTASLKMGPREVQLLESAHGQDPRSFNTIPRHQNGHVYESPKFGRRDSSPLD